MGSSKLFNERWITGPITIFAAVAIVLVGVHAIAPSENQPPHPSRRVRVAAPLHQINPAESARPVQSPIPILDKNPAYPQIGDALGTASRQPQPGLEIDLVSEKPEIHFPLVK